MFSSSRVFSSFSTNDLAQSKQFYGETLGLSVDVTDDNQMGLVGVHLPNGGELMIYEKENHIPATFTVLNFEVPNIDQAVDELTKKGIQFERYEGIPADERAISRGEGPAIAWFRDPAGNLLSVLEESK